MKARAGEAGLVMPPEPLVLQPGNRICPPLLLCYATTHLRFWPHSTNPDTGGTESVFGRTIKKKEKKRKINSEMQPVPETDSKTYIQESHIYHKCPWTSKLYTWRKTVCLL